MSTSREEPEQDEASEKSPSERRLGDRHLACFPAYIERTEGGKKTSMIRDLSVSGALLLTQVSCEVGEPVRLELFITPEDLKQFRTAVGKVTRVERLEFERADVWSHRVAVHFDTPITQFEP